MTKLLEFHRFDGRSSGWIGVINAIKWVGFKEWIVLCLSSHKLIDEGYIWERKSGN